MSFKTTNQDGRYTVHAFQKRQKKNAVNTRFCHLVEAT